MHADLLRDRDRTRTKPGIESVEIDGQLPPGVLKIAGEDALHASV